MDLPPTVNRGRANHYTTTFLAAGYKVILPDLRGCGKSDKPHVPEAYEQDAEARDMIGLTKELGIKNMISLAIHADRLLFQGSYCLTSG